MFNVKLFLIGYFNMLIQVISNKTIAIKNCDNVRINNKLDFILLIIKL